MGGGWGGGGGGELLGLDVCEEREVDRWMGWWVEGGRKRERG